MGRVWHARQHGRLGHLPLGRACLHAQRSDDTQRPPIPRGLVQLPRFKAEAPQRMKKERLVVAPCFNFIASIFSHHSPCFNFIAIIKYTKSQNPMQIVQRQTLESQQITRPQTLHVYTLQQTTHALPQQTAPHTYELVRTTTHNAIFQQNAPRKPNSCFGSSTNANTTNPKQMRNASPCRSYFR